MRQALLAALFTGILSSSGTYAVMQYHQPPPPPPIPDNSALLRGVDQLAELNTRLLQQQIQTNVSLQQIASIAIENANARRATERANAAAIARFNGDANAFIDAAKRATK